MSSCSVRSSPITCSGPPQHGQSRYSMSITTSSRGRCAGKAPWLRLGRELRRARRLSAASLAASCPAWFSAMVCSRSSSPNCSWSALSCSERRPNSWRSSRWISRRSLSFSACSSPCWCIAAVTTSRSICRRVAGSSGSVSRSICTRGRCSTSSRRGQHFRADQRIFYPASSGLRRGAGARHSQPSSSAASCAADSAILPVVVAEGQTNWPCSSRFVSRHRPIPSCQSSLISPAEHTTFYIQFAALDDCISLASFVRADAAGFSTSAWPGFDVHLHDRAPWPEPGVAELDVRSCLLRGHDARAAPDQPGRSR